MFLLPIYHYASLSQVIPDLRSFKLELCHVVYVYIE